MLDYADLAKLCDADIRGGHVERVAKHLSKLDILNVPRSWRQPLAKLCRRAGLYANGLKLLHPLLPIAGASAAGATSLPISASELAEYSVMLPRLTQFRRTSRVKGFF